MSANSSSIRNNKNTEAVESICAELTAVCDRAYAHLDFDALRALAVERCMEEPYVNGDVTVLRMTPALEELYEYFQPRTDWTALGAILDRAKIPFTVNKHISTDRYLDDETKTFTLAPFGQPHSGDFTFGVVGGVSVGTVTGDLSNLATDIHPTQQIVQAAREFMNVRWACQSDDDHEAFAAALQARQDTGRVAAGSGLAMHEVTINGAPGLYGYAGGCAGKERLPVS